MPTFQGECEGVGCPGGAGRHWASPRVGWHSCRAWLLPHHIASRGWGTSQDLRVWDCKAADGAVLPFLPVSNLFQAIPIFHRMLGGSRGGTAAHPSRSQALGSLTLSTPRWNTPALPDLRPCGGTSLRRGSWDVFPHCGGCCWVSGLPALCSQCRQPQRPSPTGKIQACSLCRPNATTPGRTDTNLSREWSEATVQLSMHDLRAFWGMHGAADWGPSREGRLGALEGPGLEPAPPGPLPSALGRPGMGLIVQGA